MILDFPAGGGYASKYLPSDVRYVPLEVSSEFAQQQDDCQLAFWDNLPVEDGEADCVLTLAALHHVIDREPFYNEVMRALGTGGRFVVADVDEKSAVGRFLNGFVD